MSCITFPNLLSLIRLGGAFSLPFLTSSSWLLFLVFALVSFSDFFDGWAARHFNQSSSFGRFLDPFADKCLVGCVYFLLWQIDMVPFWLTAFVIVRDVCIIGGVLYLWKQKALQSPAGPIVGPILLSKINTFLQLSYAGIALGSLVRLWPPCPEYGLYVVAIFTLASWISYLEILISWKHEEKN
ncbi:MAG: CDP-alcohol phosphatidyltransferase family protein [Holosporales bacterium]|jgi:CDP-diacylglycerol--glycerol-3-phosphate 3-phosphatidyltransferase|nr:CDP-alcohol phosphatidyltransferase family protein [Holosporales bacterium]